MAGNSDITSVDYTAYASLPDAADRLAALRMLDANLNRATEGLRVAEDYCRFALDDAHLTARWKQLRHDLASAVRIMPAEALAVARQTQADVGVAISTVQEGQRHSLAHVAAAAVERVQQALRVIEECLKLLAPSAAPNVESLRYQTYTLAKAGASTAHSRQRLAAARLYVLLDGGGSECAFVERAQTLISAGVDVVQLRDKRLDDRSLLARARLLRRVMDEYRSVEQPSSSPPLPLSSESSRLSASSLFIMNDRADLAVLSRADGVHVGQDELSVHEVRRIVGPEMLVGVSTHTIEQARQAVLDGANYIGCGPTFPSGTKTFHHYPGLDFLRQVAAEISLPAFAIGGITLANLPQILATGFSRVALAGALQAANDAEGQVKLFLECLRP